jgi:hypothetical protein
VKIVELCLYLQRYQHVELGRCLSLDYTHSHREIHLNEDDVGQEEMKSFCNCCRFFVAVRLFFCSNLLSRVWLRRNLCDPELWSYCN